MIRIYNNHTLQTNQRHLKSHRAFLVTIHMKVNKSKATSFLFLFNMIAKLNGRKVMQNKTNTNTELPQTMGSTLTN